MSSDVVNSLEVIVQHNTRLRTIFDTKLIILIMLCCIARDTLHVGRSVVYLYVRKVFI